MTLIVDRAIQYNWSSWVGVTSNPFSITLSAFIDRDTKATVTLKLNGRTYAYMASLKDAVSPKDLRSADFDIYVGNTINECEEFVWRKMEDFKRSFGNPTGKAHHLVHRFLPQQEQWEVTKRLATEMMSEMSWYKGNNLPER